MRAIDRIAEFLDLLIKTITALMVMVMSIIVLAQVWMRYVTKGSIPWSEEGARYLMIWLAFLAVSRAFLQNRHIGMSLAIDLLPSKIRKIIRFISNILMAGLLLFIAYQGFLFLPGVAPETTPALRISLAWAYLAIPVGMLLSFVQVVIMAFKDLLTNDSHDRAIPSVPERGNSQI